MTYFLIFGIAAEKHLESLTRNDTKDGKHRFVAADEALPELTSFLSDLINRHRQLTSKSYSQESSIQINFLNEPETIRIVSDT